jgi:hypothetical protein
MCEKPACAKIFEELIKAISINKLTLLKPLKNLMLPGFAEPFKLYLSI